MQTVRLCSYPCMTIQMSAWVDLFAYIGIIFYIHKECTCEHSSFYIWLSYPVFFPFSKLQFTFCFQHICFLTEKPCLFYENGRIFFPGNFRKNYHPSHSMQFKNPSIKINVEETEWGRKTVLQLLFSDQHFCCSRLPEW